MNERGKDYSWVFWKSYLSGKRGHFGPKNDASSQLWIRSRDFFEILYNGRVKRYMEIILMVFLKKKFHLGQMPHFRHTNVAYSWLWTCSKDFLKFEQWKMSRGTWRLHFYISFFWKNFHLGQIDDFGLENGTSSQLWIWNFLKFCIVKWTLRYMKFLLLIFVKKILLGVNGLLWTGKCCVLKTPYLLLKIFL